MSWTSTLNAARPWSATCWSCSAANAARSPSSTPARSTADVAPTPALAAMREALRLAGILGIACARATALLFPYIMLVVPQALAKVPVPIPLLVLLQALQALLLLGLFAFCGLRMGHRVGL